MHRALLIKPVTLWLFIFVTMIKSGGSTRLRGKGGGVWGVAVQRVTTSLQSPRAPAGVTALDSSRGRNSGTVNHPI